MFSSLSSVYWPSSYTSIMVIDEDASKHEPAHRELGGLLREARLKKGMSLGQLASAVGRSSSSVRRWERGEVAPAAGVLPKLGAILEIEPSVLDTARPESSTPSNEEESEASEKRVTTVEQPPVQEAPSRDGSVEEEGQERPARGAGLMTDVWAVLVPSDRGWVGWLRGLLTTGALILMIFVLVWAVGELFDALRAVLASFDVGSSGNQSP